MTFEKQAIRKSIVPDMISALLVYSYSIIPTKLITDLPFKDFTGLTLCVLVMMGGIQFLIAPIFDHMLYSRISNRLEKFKTTEATQTERTKLLEDLMLHPFYSSLITFIYFAIGSFIVFFYYNHVMKLSNAVCVLSLFECLFGSLFSSLYAYSNINKLVNTYAAEIVKKGVDKKYIMQKKYFGVNFKTQFIIYIIIPAVLTTILINLAFTIGYKQARISENFHQISTYNQMLNFGFTCIMNVIVQITMVLAFYRRIYTNTKKMTAILEEINISKTTEVKYLETDLEDEFAFNHFLANEMLSLLQNTLLHFESIGHQLNASALNLGHISTETNSTYLQQSSGTTEIVSSMKETTNKAHQIIENISEVYELAKHTEIDVRRGQKILEKYHDNIESINSHNLKTSTGIRDLSEKIRNIWEVVTIINSIADQTKIIAFNAELEATSIKESTGNFKNVSNEIRRLANGTMDSTKEIKDRITEIQTKADILKNTLENTRPHIAASISIANELTNNFHLIQESAQTNSISASRIQDTIKEQTDRFDVINATLQKINDGLQNYDEATKNISASSRNLQLSAQELENVSKNKEVENE